MSNGDQQILIVDDDQDILIAAKLLLKRHFGQIVTCNSPDQIAALMAAQSFDAVLLDMNFSPAESSGQQGLYWLKQILSIDPDAVVVMITAHGGLDLAVEAMKFGATDFIAKPWQNEKVIATLSAAVQLHQSRAETHRLKQSNQALVEAATSHEQNLLGQSHAMQEVHSIINRAAPTDANVLILGENGTGKELVARQLHQQSLRAEQIFMSVDLGAIAESLFESELFGHKKGAFTGANKDRVGRFVAANGGTLFLDEIANIPLHLQAKLLTVLEQRKVTPVGSDQPVDVDVRVIAATNMDRRELQQQKYFRQDLLFRLNTVEIQVPPLRDRAQDIAEIGNYYARLYAHKYRKPEKLLSKDALNAAQTYDWPGNVRALRHAIERAVILSQNPQLEAIDLQINPVSPIADPVKPQMKNEPKNILEHTATNLDQHADLNLQQMEKQLVELALKKHRYNISKAAKELGLTRATLYRRMERYGF